MSESTPPRPFALVAALTVAAGALTASIASTTRLGDRLPWTRPPAPLAFELVAAPIPVGPMPNAPRTADLDGDGDQDVIVVCGPCCGRPEHEDSGHVQILLNDGAGGLSPAGARIRIGPSALGADVGDVNGDGILDLVCFHHDSYELAVLRGMGVGRFHPPTFVTMHDGDSPHVHAVELADVNGDGHLDALATLVDDHAMAVLLGDGAGGFTAAHGQPFFAHRHPYGGLRATDLDADGHLDAVMTDVRGGGVTVLVGSGTGMFSPRNGFDLETTMPIHAAERPTSMALGDLDGDGDLDGVAFLDESDEAVVMVNVGDGAFVEHEAPLLELAEAALGGTLADLDGDGHLDVVASGTRTDQVSVALGRGAGRFGPSFGVAANAANPHVVVADMNGDGLLDLVTANDEGSGEIDAHGTMVSGTVSVLLQQRATTDD